MSEDRLSCSFCGLNKLQTKILVAGQDAHICDQCIEQAFSILNHQNKSNFASSGQSDFWNREHVWPKSHGNFGFEGDWGELGANTDAHHLKPVDSSINSIRSNKDFDYGGEIVFNGDEETNCFVSEFTFEPRDEVKVVTSNKNYEAPNRVIAEPYQSTVKESVTVKPTADEGLPF